jgi:hypothetical protein
MNAAFHCRTALEALLARSWYKQKIYIAMPVRMNQVWNGHVSYQSSAKQLCIVQHGSA